MAKQISYPHEIKFGGSVVRIIKDPLRVALPPEIVEAKKLKLQKQATKKSGKKSKKQQEPETHKEYESFLIEYYVGGKRKRARRSTHEKAVELSPDTALFHYDLGLALYDLNQPEAAMEEFAGIVAGDPKLKSAWSSLMLSAMTNLALSQEKLGRADEAIQTLLPALDNAVGVLFNLGFLHFRAKRFEAALPFAHAAYVLKPNNEDIVHQYGAILNELKRPREAVKFLKQATQLEPTCASAWYDLGLAFARLKYRKRARTCFLKSLQLKPNHAWSYYDLACLDALDGNRDAAFKKLRQAVVCGFRNIAHLRQDSDLRSLRRDARWTALLANIGDLEKSNN